MDIPHFDHYERLPVSSTTLTLLRDFVADNPLHTDAADWEEVFQAVVHHGILGLTQRHLATNQNHAVPEGFRQAVSQMTRLSALRMALTYRTVTGILQKLNQSGIDYLVVKGPALAYGVYPDPHLRAFNDLDLIVRERDWAAMHCFLTQQGFEQENDLPAPPPKIVPQWVRYETTYTHRETHFKIEVHYDDILNAGLAARDIEGFWSRAQTLDICGTRVKTLSLEDQLVHLCAHVHYHGYTRMSWFADILLIVRHHADKLDWERFFGTVATEDIKIPVYYTLHYLQRLFDVSLPAFVLERLQPNRIQSWFHNRYLPDEKVLSFQPMWRPDFSFYFLPLLRRLIPDLVVMGRKREKLACLAHLMAPPRAWLCYYYHLDESRWVGPYYLLHPLRLLAIYSRELFNSPQRAQNAASLHTSSNHSA